MTKPVLIKAFERYKELLMPLLSRRALSPLSQEEEAERAAERADLWDQLSVPKQAELENWIELQMALAPPWIIYTDGGHDIAILPAGRPGEVAKLDGVPRAVATEVVQSVNQNRMSVAQALDVIAYHRSRIT